MHKLDFFLVVLNVSVTLWTFYVFIAGFITINAFLGCSIFIAGSWYIMTRHNQVWKELWGKIRRK